MKRKFKVLYTHQKTKKKKVWQDGVFGLSRDGCRGFLYDDTKKEISTLYLNRQKVEDGVELESEKYLIQVEEEIGASETNSAQNSQAVSSTTDPGKPVEKFHSLTAPPTVKTKFSVPRKTQPNLALSSGYKQTVEACSESMIHAKKVEQPCVNSIWSSVTDNKYESPICSSSARLSPPSSPLAPKQQHESSSVRRNTFELLQLLGDCGTDSSVQDSGPSKVCHRVTTDLEVELPSFLQEEEMCKKSPVKSPKSKFEADVQNDPSKKDILECLERLITRVVQNAARDENFEPAFWDEVPGFSVTEQEMILSQNEFVVQRCSCEQIYTCADKMLSRKKPTNLKFEKRSDPGENEKSFKQDLPVVSFEDGLSRFDLFLSDMDCGLSKANSTEKESLKLEDCQKSISLLADSDSLEACVPDFDLGLSQLQASPELTIGQGESCQSLVVGRSCGDFKKKHNRDNSEHESKKFYSVSDFNDSQLFDLLENDQACLPHVQEKHSRLDQQQNSFASSENFIPKPINELEKTKNSKRQNLTDPGELQQLVKTNLTTPESFRGNPPLRLSNQKNNIKLAIHNSATSPLANQREDISQSTNHVASNAVTSQVTCDDESFSYSPLRSSQLSADCRSSLCVPKFVQESQHSDKKPMSNDQRVPNLFEDFKNVFDDELLLAACMDLEEIASSKQVSGHSESTVKTQSVTEIKKSGVFSALEVDSKLAISEYKSSSRLLNVVKQSSIVKNETNTKAKDAIPSTPVESRSLAHFNAEMEQLRPEPSAAIDSVLNLSFENNLRVVPVSQNISSHASETFSIRGMGHVNDESIRNGFGSLEGASKMKPRKRIKISDQESISGIGGVLSKQAVSRSRSNWPVRDSEWVKHPVSFSQNKHFTLNQASTCSSNLSSPYLPLTSSNSQIYNAAVGNKCSKFMASNAHEYDLMESRLMTSDPQPRSFDLQSPAHTSVLASPFHQVPDQINRIPLRINDSASLQAADFSRYDITRTDFFRPNISIPSYNPIPPFKQSPVWLLPEDFGSEPQIKLGRSKWSKFESNDQHLQNSKNLRRRWMEEMVAREKVTTKSYMPEIDMLKTPQLSCSQQNQQHLWSTYGSD